MNKIIKYFLMAASVVLLSILTLSLTPVSAATKKIQSVEVTNPQTIVVKLSEAKKLSLSAFTVESGIRDDCLEIAVTSISNSKNQIYTLKCTKSFLSDGSEVTVSVKGYGSFTTVFKYPYYKNYTYDNAISLKQNSKCAKITVGYTSYGKVSSFKVDKLPKGMKLFLSNGRIYAKGTPKQVGVTTSKITYTDELGTKWKMNYTWKVFSEKKLMAMDTSDTVMLCPNSKEPAMAYLSTDVLGGSGYYKFSVVSDPGKVTSVSDNGLIVASLKKVGNYKVKIKVTDQKNSKLSATFMWKLSAVMGVTVSGKITSTNGKAISDAQVLLESRYSNATGYSRFEGYSDEKGQYSIVVLPGVYTLRAIIYKGTYENLYQYDVSITKKVTKNLKFLNTYAVDITSGNKKLFSIDDSTYWKGMAQYGTRVYVKLPQPGQSKVATSTISISWMRYIATVTLNQKTVKAGKVTAKITSENMAQALTLNKAVKRNSITAYFSYKAASAGYYTFRVDGLDVVNANNYISLYDSDENWLNGDRITKGTKNGYVVYLKKGQTCYCVISDNDCVSYTMKVSKGIVLSDITTKLVTEKTVTISNSGDKYAFTPDTTGEYTFVVNNYSEYAGFTVYDNSWERIYGSGSSIESAGVYYCEYSLVANTTYYIDAFAGGSNNNTTFCIKKGTALATMSKKAELNKEYTDVDGLWFSFSPTVTGTYTMIGKNEEGADNYLEVVLGNTMEQIWRDDFRDYDGYSYYQYELTAGMTYYMKAYSMNTLKLAKNTLLDLVYAKVNLNTTYSKTLDKVYYSFTPSETGNYTIIAEASDSMDMFRSYISDSQFVYYEDACCILGQKEYLQYSFTAGTTYYIQLNYSSSIRIEKKELRFVANTELTLGKTKTAAQGKHWFCFTPSANGTYRFDATGESLSMNMYLYEGASDSDIGPSQSIEYDENEIEIARRQSYNLEKGKTYFLYVDSYSQAIVNISVVKL